MPGFILHMGATVMCAHGGQATPTVTNARVKVGGQPICTLASVYTVAGCSMPPPPAGNGPCMTAKFITNATRITASGLPVLLQDSQALCAPTSTPLTVVTTQVRVKGM
jgi:hypothetical protein